MLWIISAIENEEDRTFVEEIYLKYEKRMYVISYNILNDHHDAEDCVHETVKIIIDSLDKFKSAYKNQALNTLIMIACKNCAINMYNKRKNRVQYVCEQYDLNVIPDYDPPIDEQIMDKLDIQTINNLINQLEPIYQDVITLRIMELRYEEIGKILGITPQTARKRMYRARQKLSELGRPYLNDKQAKYS